MKRSNCTSRSERGFSLVEILIATALLGGLGLVAAKLVYIVGQNSKTMKRKENHLQYHVHGLGVMQKYLKGLKPHQFDNELFYRIDSSKNFTRNSSTLTGAALTNYSGIPDRFTSHIFQKKMSDRSLNYISVCLPVDQAMKPEAQNYAALQKNNLWPFIRAAAKGFEVHCCQRSNPMCNNNVLKKNSDLFVQMFRQDPKTGSLTPLLKSGEFGSVSSVGFFLFSNQSNDKVLHIRFFTFFNECFSQRLVYGRTSGKCHDHLDIKANEFIEEFNYAAESLNTLGGEIGL